MKKIFLTIIVIIFVIPLLNYEANFAILPDGERAFWKWFGASLGLITSKECLWNTGEVRPCTLTELSIMLSYY